jgi:hypothetical protein
MNQKLYLKYLHEYTLDALEKAGNSVTEAADYLERKSKPGPFSRDQKEKKEALKRVIKVFQETRERSWYIALKSLGFDDLAKEKI